MYKKVVPPTSTTEEYYLMDAFGKTLAIENMKALTDKWTYYLVTNERDAQLKPIDNSVQFNYKEATFFLYDHLGNTRVSYSKLDNGLVVHSLTDYFPYGKVLREYVSTRPRYLTTQHERDTETDLDYRGARYYDSEYGRFLSVDPLAYLRVEWTPYNAMRCNPILNIDPTGALDHEYDKDGNKISDLGGDEINFYHQANGDTKVEDQKTCATNIIQGGEALIRGFTKRNANISWFDIATEWNRGTGPTKSMFADFTGKSSSGPFSSLHNTFSSYTSPARKESLNSEKQKGTFKMGYGNANPLVAKDMWEQMWGRSNVSWYKLGDKTLFMMNDSKSMTSFAYRLLPNWERSAFNLNGNTYQTYMWIENSTTIQNKVNQNNTYWQNQSKQQDKEVVFGPKF